MTEYIIFGNYFNKIKINNYKTACDLCNLNIIEKYPENVLYDCLSYCQRKNYIILNLFITKKLNFFKEDFNDSVNPIIKISNISQINKILRLNFTFKNLISCKHRQNFTNEILILKFLSYQTLSVPKFKCLILNKNECPIIVMDSLQDDINFMSKLPKSIFKNFLKKIISQLHEIHKCGIYHGDIRPENIMVDSNLNIKFIDFEFSKFMGLILSKNVINGYFKNKYSPDKNIIYNYKLITKNQCLTSDIYGLANLILTFFLGKSKSKLYMLDDEVLYSNSYFYQNIIYFSEPKNTQLIDIYDPQLKNLLFYMLNINSYERPTCMDILNHPYFAENYNIKFNKLITNLNDFGADFINLKINKDFLRLENGHPHLKYLEFIYEKYSTLKLPKFKNNPPKIELLEFLDFNYEIIFNYLILRGQTYEKILIDNLKTYLNLFDSKTIVNNENLFNTEKNIELFNLSLKIYPILNLIEYWVIKLQILGIDSHLIYLLESGMVSDIFRFLLDYSFQNIHNYSLKIIIQSSFVKNILNLNIDYNKNELFDDSLVYWFLEKKNFEYQELKIYYEN